jgi:Ca-activated chloride channel family protein
MPFVFLSPVLGMVALIGLPIVLGLWNWRQRTVSHSRVRMHRGVRNSSLLSRLPTVCLIVAWLAASAALALPAIPHSTDRKVVDTRDIFVAVDISGSMSNTISRGGGATPGWCAQYGCQSAASGSSYSPYGTSGGSKKDPYDPKLTPNKLDLARHAVKQFIDLRRGDRIAIVEFDDNVYYSWPFSMDTDVLQKKADQMTYIGGGTNFDGPAADASGMGPLQAAINMFTKYGKSESKVFVLVTDGGSTISPDRMAQLTKQFEQLGIQVYVIGVGDDWTNNSSITTDLRNFVKALHGEVINAGSADQLTAGIEKINNVFTSKVTVDTQVDYKPIYDRFVLVALVAFMLFLVLNALTRRTS